MDVFDVKAEAKKIEHMAKERLDSGTLFSPLTAHGQDLARQLCEEWRSLNTEQRLSVANQLSLDYDNGRLNALPRPHIITNMEGEMIGVRFTASAWDWHLGPSEIEIKASNGKITEMRVKGSEHPKEIGEYVIDDMPKFLEIPAVDLWKSLKAK